LIGPIIGAFFVNGAKSWFTVAFPEFWLYFLGALFIAVTLFLPNGIIGLLRKLGGIIGLLRKLGGILSSSRGSPEARK
jgi:urea transport system permease protein